ncbi:MAG: ribonuclease H-like domain-containing protein [Lachnospiraceae bacterium]|nr:ribonuclease H-like domain-containing protein [Lachnospiraceae bacterium]
MKQINKVLPLPETPYITQYFTENCVFFDIETTGFSPKNAFVYLIGIAVRKGNQIHIQQFLAEKRTDEKDILSAFYQQIAYADTLITFNGTGFDIPFLKGRDNLYNLEQCWDTYWHIDLYKLTGKFAHLFHLPNKKQKSLELFLGINRDDLYSGGELISVYRDYEKDKDSHKEELLLLHNYEDVLGMTDLLSLLSYRDLFSNHFHVNSAKMQTYRPYHAEADAWELFIDISVEIPFPKPFFYQGDFCTIKCEGDSVRLVTKIFYGELKFFYDNYKDYYYLPEEDMAVHKSVASFVDAAHRKKATATTCYTKKTGYFLPQTDKIFTPVFYPEKKSRISFFEVTEEFLTDKDALYNYAVQLIASCLH